MKHVMRYMYAHSSFTCTYPIYDVVVCPDTSSYIPLSDLNLYGQSGSHMHSPSPFGAKY